MQHGVIILKSRSQVEIPAQISNLETEDKIWDALEKLREGMYGDELYVWLHMVCIHNDTSVEWSVRECV